MLRVMALSIALTVTASPHAVLWCLASCGHRDAGHVFAIEACHEGAAPSGASAVAGDEACSGPLLGALAFVKEDSARTGSGSPEYEALAVLRYQLARVDINRHPAATSAARWMFERAPGATVLRI